MRNFIFLLLLVLVTQATIAQKTYDPKSLEDVKSYYINLIENTDTLSDDYAKIALIQAISYNRLDVVKRLIDNGVPLNFTDSIGWTPLTYACLYGNPKITEILLNNGADFNISPEYKKNTEPLIFSILEFRKNLKNKKDIEIEFGDELKKTISAAWYTSKSKDVDTEITKLLVLNIKELAINCKQLMLNNYNFPFLGSKPLTLSNNYNIIDSVYYQYGLYITARNKWIETSFDHRRQKERHISTEIPWFTFERWLQYKVSEFDYRSVIELLIKNGYDLDTRDISKNTPLKTASGYGFVDIVDLLIENKADINAANEFDDYPLHASLRYGNPDISMKLINNGATIKKDMLAYAAKHQASIPILKTFIDKGLTITTNTKNPWITGYLNEKSSGIGLDYDERLKTIEYLLDNGAPTEGIFFPVIREDNSSHLLYDYDIHHDVYYNYSDIYKLLIKKGINVNMQDEDGYTPLMRTKKPYVMKLLIDAGADVTITNNYGDIVLSFMVGKLPYFRDNPNKEEKEKIKILTKAVIDLGEPNALGKAPLEILVDNFLFLKVRKAIDAGADWQTLVPKLSANCEDEKLANLILYGNFDLNDKAKNGKSVYKNAVSACKKSSHSKEAKKKTMNILKDFKKRSRGINKIFEKTETNAFWKIDKTGLYFYYNGELIRGLENTSSGKHCIVFYPEIGKNFVLKNFEDRKDGVIRDAEIFENSPTNAYWKSRKSINYHLYINYNGKKIKSFKTTFSGDDMIVSFPESEKKFILKDFKNKQDSKIRVAEYY